MTPKINTNQLPSSATPDEITPQANAHIGGNQVTGLRSSRTVEALGVLDDPDATGVATAFIRFAAPCLVAEQIASVALVGW